MTRLPRLLVAALLAGAAGIAAVGHLPGGGGAERREGGGCTDANPIELPVQGVADLFLCADPAARSTLVVNGTRAVWTLRLDPGTPVARGRMSSLNLSFLDLIAQTAPTLPAGASMLVLAPPSEVALAVDTELTVAQLVHDQLVSTMEREGNDVMWGILRLAPSDGRRMLALCLDEVVQRIGPAGAVLADEERAERVAEAAMSTAAASWSGCGAAWLDAKLQGGVQPGELTSLAYDVRNWGANPTFALRGSLAAAAARSAGAIGPLPDPHTSPPRLD